MQRSTLLRFSAIAFAFALIVGIIFTSYLSSNWWLYLGAGVLFSLFLSARTFSETRDLFHPLVFYPFVYMLFSLGLALYVPMFGIPQGFETETVLYSRDYSQLVTTLFVGLLGLWIGVWLGDKIARSHKFGSRNVFARRLTRLTIPLRHLALLGMILGSVVLWYQILRRGGIEVLWQQYGKDQFTYDTTYYLSQLAQFIWIPSFLLFTAETLKYSRAGRRLFVSVLPFVLPLVIYGARSVMLVVAVAVALSWHVRKRPLRISSLLIALIPLLIVLSVVGQVRGSRSIDYLDISSRGLLGEVLGPAAGAGAITLTITALVPLTIPYQYGLTYLSAIFNLVPGFFFGSQGRPFLNPSLVFHDVFSPSLSDHGFGFSMTAEAYMNWGIWGVLPTLIIVGLFLGFSFRYMKARADSYSIAVYALIVFEAVWFLRADSTVFLKAILIPVLIIKVLSMFADKEENVRAASRADGPWTREARKSDSSESRGCA
jgi:oligosaccharide repeat unit polymerase